ncbi:hypothetical protein N3K66_007113 [Trichothecium roseum]|uniref:Uncharacterized protein n=1 Tax=Trichothecium roseum TaxID=47278 RepID=A0ACC0UZ07_9HYPO|nr:hypothetical protein N3K66_007113 [Trichothecium roseum]
MVALSDAQVEAYLDRIHLPPQTRRLLALGPDHPSALGAVAALQRHHLRHVPFENLGLTYAAGGGSSRVSRTLPQDTASVYDRVVTRRAGGVCDQLHLLFAELLRHFGFAVYCTGARINAAAGMLYASGVKEAGEAEMRTPRFGPWVHLNTVVTVGEQDYVVDTGHGPSGFPTPVALVHDRPEEDMAPRQCRMIHGPLPGDGGSGSGRGRSKGGGPKWWRMQTRWSPSQPWLDVWAFAETEWQSLDFELLRKGYEAVGTGWAEPRVCCFRTTYDGEGNANGEGDGGGEGVRPTGFMLIIDDELRRGRADLGGKVEVLRKFYAEADRVAALGEVFGIRLGEDEVGGIAGHPAEIRDGDFDYYG